LSHGKSRDWRHAVAPSAQGGHRFAQAEAKRADHARGDDRHAHIFPVYGVRFRHLNPQGILDFLLLSQKKHPTNVAETKTVAWKLVDCQLSLFSGDLKSDKRKQ
jgi:hypothetical protein